MTHNEINEYMKDNSIPKYDRRPRKQRKEHSKFSLSQTKQKVLKNYGRLIIFINRCKNSLKIPVKRIQPCIKRIIHHAQVVFNPDILVGLIFLYNECN